METLGFSEVLVPRAGKGIDGHTEFRHQVLERCTKELSYNLIAHVKTVLREEELLEFIQLMILDQSFSKTNYHILVSHLVVVFFCKIWEFLALLRRVKVRLLIRHEPRLEFKQGFKTFTIGAQILSYEAGDLQQIGLQLLEVHLAQDKLV